MNTKRAERAFRIFLILAFVLGTVWMPDRRAGAQEPNPWIQAFTDMDRVNANNWPMDAVITMTVNGSYNYTSKAGQSSWDPNGTTAGFDIRDYGLQAGDEISMTGEGITRSMTVSALQITNIDVNTSTISGMADADKQVYVWVKDDGGMWLTPASDGSWTAEFSPLSFVPGTEGGVTQPDLGGNATQTSWHIPDPYIQTFSDHNTVYANDWPLGTVVSMIINGSTTYTATVGASSWDPYGTAAEFRVENHDIQAGDEIGITGAGFTRGMTVTSLTITNIDVSNAAVSGMADKEKVFHVWVNGGSDFYITPDLDGKWTANFSPFVFVPGTNGGAQQTDEFGNYTQIDWRVPTPLIPQISVVPDDPNSGPANIILGQDFEMGTTVNLCIDNPPFDSECDYTDLQIVPSEPNGFAGYQFQFTVDPSIFQIMAGQRVQLDNGLHTEEHIVTNMRLLSVNWDTEQVSGTADPGSELEVPAAGEGRYVIRRVTAGIDGKWAADFAHPGNAPDEQETLDLRLGHVFFIPEQVDENGNSTKFWWQPPNPIISARPFERQITGYDWPDGALITLTIDDPVTAVSPDYTATTTASMQYFGQTEAMFNLDGLFTLEAGDIVQMTDAATTKTHIVTNLAIQSIDVATDRVSGVADPGDTIGIFVWASQDNATAWRDVIADSNGNWVADFSIPVDGMTYDVAAGTWGETQEFDDDRDNTNVYWRVPNPAFSVLPDEDSIEGNDWPLESILTIKVGDSDNVDYTTTTLVNAADLDHSQTWFKFDLADDFNLQPGQIVTVSDAKTTKQTIVANRTITNIDPATDIITGKEESNIVYVVLWVCDDNGCGARYKDVDPDGNWSVNFAIPGAQGWEDVIVDIQSGTNGGIFQGDVDGDGTTYQQWTVTVIPWALKGFYQPVDMNSVYNVVKGGSTVPLKFEIFAGFTELTDVANIKSLTYAQTSCDATATTDEIETIATGGTSLRYADGQFIYNWKTPKSAGKCYRVTMTAIDGSTLMAYFKLK